MTRCVLSFLSLAGALDFSIILGLSAWTWPMLPSSEVVTGAKESIQPGKLLLEAPGHTPLDI
jgi:hypothetical protein